MLFTPYFIWLMTLNIAHRLQPVDVVKISSAKHRPNLSAGALDNTNLTSRTKKGKNYPKNKRVRRSKHANPIFTSDNSNLRVSRDLKISSLTGLSAPIFEMASSLMKPTFTSILYEANAYPLLQFRTSLVRQKSLYPTVILLRTT